MTLLYLAGRAERFFILNQSSINDMLIEVLKMVLSRTSPKGTLWEMRISNRKKDSLMTLIIVKYLSSSSGEWQCSCCR